MLWSWHQLLALHAGKLAERAVWCFIAPDALRGGVHRISAVAFLIVAIILIAMHHNLITNRPAGDFDPHGPHDARRIGTSNVIGLLMAIKGADRHA